MSEVQSQVITEQELSQILSGNVDSIKQDPNKQESPKPVDKKEPDVIKPELPKDKLDESLDFNWKDIIDEGKKEPEEEVIEEVKKPVEQSIKKDIVETDSKKAGRPSSFVTLINEMVEANELFGYEDGEIKTLEEARELVKLNLDQAKKAEPEVAFEEKIKTFSPQIQAIIEYAKQGGQDITSLLSAISQYEQTSSFDIESEDGQAQIISEYNKIQGFDDEYNKEEIETLKDVNKLKDKAQRILPKLEQLAQERINMIQEEQTRMAEQVKQARENYKKTIHTTLSKEQIGDLKLNKQEKSLIWNALTEDKYTTYSGQRTNAFWKKLEELQAGDKADYDHFLSIVYYALDKDTFQSKLKEKIGTENTINTVRKLKIADTKPSTNDAFDQKETKPVPQTGRFKRPVQF